MFSKLFEERDKTITYLVKLGDCIGRSLRENISLFSIDSQKNEVTYLTESDKIISGNYIVDKDVILKNINIQDSSVFDDDSVFDSYVNEKIHSFVEGVHYSEYSSANDSFSEILELWENRLKLGSLRGKLAERVNKLAEIENIVESKEFQNLIELSPQFIDFLSENIEKISCVPEIKNAVNLSNAVTAAFDFPRLSYENLQEGQSYILKDGATDSIYEMICRQELVKRELVESKKDFNVIWASNPNIRKLAGMLFEEDEVVIPVLAEALRDIPYLALSSKKTLSETFNQCLAKTEVGISEKDIQRFASRIFEMKKEVKEMFIEGINEKYGVNVQNLQETASFKSLINTQIVIFEALSRLAPKGAVLKQVLAEVAQSLKGKSGVQGIDINNYLYEAFRQGGYTELLEKTKTVEKHAKVDFKRVGKELGDIKSIISTLKDKVTASEKDQEYPSDETIDTETESAGATSPPQEVSAEKDTGEAPPPNEAEPEGVDGVEPVASQDQIVSDFGNLENMVSDIAAEISGAGKKETAETEEEE